jgi:hypothetical protein
MNKQELIKKYEDLFEKLYAFPIVTINGVIEDFKQLDETQKVMIPRFIADWIVQAKEDGYNIAGAINEAPRGAVDDWLELENVDIFAEAWINGYTIEKEPKYTVKFKATKQYLCNDDLGPHFDPSFRTNFTKSDLEKLDLGWVFDCEGMEVEKV